MRIGLVKALIFLLGDRLIFESPLLATTCSFAVVLILGTAISVAMIIFRILGADVFWTTFRLLYMVQVPNMELDITEKWGASSNGFQIT